MSPRTVRRTLLSLVFALLVGACSAAAETSTTTTTTTDSATPASGPVALPANPDPPKSATIYATLRGDPALDGGCVWLQQIATEFSVLWPPGFTAEFDPIRLYDESGTLIAEEGDQLVVTGGFAAEAADYQPYRCAVGTELWLAGTVERDE